ncbi:hypothetical protein AB9F38_34015, partial [Rhizobium leguminosarum]
PSLGAARSRSRIFPPSCSESSRWSIAAATEASASSLSQGSGLIVIGMGKLGACELNYSSDIDLVVVFDEKAGIVPDPDDAIEVFPRMMRR